MDDGKFQWAKTAAYDWSKLDAMDAGARTAAAVSDPDAQPLTPQDMPHLRRR